MIPSASGRGNFKEKFMTNTKENKMGVQPVGKLLAGMAIPMMISMLVQAFYNVVDSIFVSQLGENALTAVSLAFPLQNLLIAFGAGTAIGMNALLSKSLGAKEFDTANRSANTTVFLYFLSYIVFVVVGLFLTKPFYLAQTTDSQIVKYGVDYTTVCLSLSLGIFYQFCFERMLQSTGKAHMAMITQIIGAVTNIILDPILIFGLFGFPRLEVLGAAVATVTGQIVAAICALFMNLKYNKEIKISFKQMRWHKDTVKEIYRVGVPSIIMQSIGSVMTFGMNLILISFTTTATAVFGAYFKLQSFIFMPIFGLNNGMIPIIAYNYGAKNKERVVKTVKLAVITAMSIMTVGFLAFEIIPHILLGFFNPSENMLSIGTTALRIIGTHYLLAGFCIIAGSVCQAIGNPMHSLIVSICRQLLVLLPAAWLLSLTGNLNLVWLSFPIAEIASLILSSIFLKKTLKKIEEIM